MKKHKKLFLNIGWLYPRLMSTYGDRGNIICLTKRCEWRNIEVEVKKLDEGFSEEELEHCDFLFMGGAQDRQQKIVSTDLKKEKAKVLREMIENGTPGLYICGAYQFLGKYYKEADGTIIDGLNILDLYTENPGDKGRRLIGNVAIKVNWVTLNSSKPSIAKIMPHLVGFENHGGRTYLGNSIKPLGEISVGFGNNGEDKTEGAIYKNSVGSYLHGPILPKNPHIADWLITKAVEKKYKKTVELPPLDDSLEWQAHNEIVTRLRVRL